MFRSTHPRHKEGYILLLTLLTISIILAISFGIFALSLKEVMLASFLRDSAKAFAAADRAAECALYWDRGAQQVNQATYPYTVFPTSTIYTNLPNPALAGIQCNGALIWSVAWPYTADAVSANSNFSLTFSDGSFASVNIYKNGDETQITADGFNNTDLTSPRRTQRTIEIDTNF